MVNILFTIVNGIFTGKGDGMSSEDLGIAKRLGRLKSGDSCTKTVGSRLTGGEERELIAAAERNGRNVSEWSREVLLREARRSKDDALFTEVIAIRMLLNNLLGPIAGGQTVTEKNYVEIMANVRLGKRNAAREVMQQYTEAEQKEQ